FFYILLLQTHIPSWSSLFPYTTLFRSNLLLMYIHEELAKIGAPLDLVQVLPAPVNKAKTIELMKQVDFLTVTGSRNNVRLGQTRDRKSTRLNSSHVSISYAVFCLKNKR